MNKNKGFTLIELLGVIVVLLLILLIAIPSVVSTLERNKHKINEQKEEVILNAAEIFANKYKKNFDYDSFLIGNCGIEISWILDSDLITEEELLDSEGNLLYEDYYVVVYDKNNGTYKVDSSINACYRF